MKKCVVVLQLHVSNLKSHPNTPSCAHDKHVPVPRATAKSPPSPSSFITRRHIYSSLLVSLN